MKVNELLNLWEQTSAGELTQETFNIHLPIRDASRLQALADLYPRRSVAEIITDLLGAALDEVETSLPYVRGQRIVGTDELGDPLYEDVGPTPRYLSLTQEHLRNLRKPSGGEKH